MINYNKKHLAFTVAFIIFLFYAVSLVFPFVWLFNNSFKSNTEFFKDVWSLPEQWLFSNYVDGFTVSIKNFTLMKMMGNSVFIAVVGVALNMFFTVCAAYIFAKFRFFGRNFIYALVITFMIIPTTGSTPALYRFLVNLKLYDTSWGLFILQSNAFSSGFLFLYACFVGISPSYAEAAVLDGANNWTVFLRVMAPQAIPVITSLSVIQFIGVWNDFYAPYMFLPSYPTVAVGLDLLNSQMTYDTNYPLMFAVMVISMIPVLILFVCFQKTIMENTVAGGLKG